MNVDGLSGGTDIIDVFWVGEKIGGALTVYEKVVGGNGGTPRFLGEDDDTGGIAGN
jgi:hypothetical protein